MHILRTRRWRRPVRALLRQLARLPVRGVPCACTRIHGGKPAPQLRPNRAGSEADTGVVLIDSLQLRSRGVFEQRLRLVSNNVNSVSLRELGFGVMSNKSLALSLLSSSSPLASLQLFKLSTPVSTEMRILLLRARFAARRWASIALHLYTAVSTSFSLASQVHADFVMPDDVRQRGPIGCGSMLREEEPMWTHLLPTGAPLPDLVRRTPCSKCSQRGAPLSAHAPQ